jgi:Predicted O-methyltransferase
MPNSWFRFKQFTVGQDLCAMKVGTDGVLLGAWTNIRDAETILDAGTGTGLIALMLAQRSQGRIDAIDIDEGAFRQAELNFRQSPFAERLRSVHVALQDYHPTKHYDLIVSNPPYFSQSLPSPDESRTTARHDDNLSLDELINHSVRLLSHKGRICLILPSERIDDALASASNHGLFLIRKILVCPTVSSPPKRVLLEFSRIHRTMEEDELAIEKERHVYTEAFIGLTKAYYMKM